MSSERQEVYEVMYNVFSDGEDKVCITAGSNRIYRTPVGVELCWDGKDGKEHYRLIPWSQVWYVKGTG